MAAERDLKNRFDSEKRIIQQELSELQQKYHELREKDAGRSAQRTLFDSQLDAAKDDIQLLRLTLQQEQCEKAELHSSFVSLQQNFIRQVLIFC